jgi:AcrR family transcriptional regulator
MLLSRSRPRCNLQSKYGGRRRGCDTAKWAAFYLEQGTGCQLASWPGNRPRDAVETSRSSDAKHRGRLSRQRVLAAAIALADERGLEALTMRELGKKLGVEAMSLYNHVVNKDDLLDGMIDQVVSEIDLPSGLDWREAMRRRATSAHHIFSRHPWASALIDSRQTSGLERLRYLDWVIGTLRQAGFSLELAVRAFSLLDSYIYGFARQQLNMSSGGDATSEEMAAVFLRAVPAGEYPYLTEMIVGHAMQVAYDESADFQFGLNLILDGLEGLLGSGQLHPAS